MLLLINTRKCFFLISKHDRAFRCIQTSKQPFKLILRSYSSCRNNHRCVLTKSNNTVSSINQQWRVTQYTQLRWKMSIEDIYQKKTQLEHTLLRPDTYIGSVEPDCKSMWVVAKNGKHMVQQDVTFVPGLFKIFDEILVNAADNKINDPNMSSIKIDIDPSKNMISIWNDGEGIPIEMHKEYNMYIPTLIFGHLLTSSNYNDMVKRITGGRHGFGAKLCNIFSKKFILQTSSKEKGLHFQQTWTKNMTEVEAPVISDATGENFTCVTFYPDLTKFNVKKISKDLMALFRRRAYDVAASTKGVKLVFNGETIQVSNFRDYVEMHLQPKSETDDKIPVAHTNINKNWEISVAVSRSGFNQTSFVNSIYTEKGGTHVKYVTDILVESLLPVVQKQVNFGGIIKPTMIKNNLWVFINCLIENPAFDSQTKETLTLQPKHFGSTCRITQGFVNQLAQIGLIDEIVASCSKNKIKKMDQVNATNRLAGIDKLEDAKNAGRSESENCTLILTEGDSAKATALAGLSVIGRANYGVFPLTGKIMNARINTLDQIMENKQFQNLMKILGLQFSQTYDTPSSRKKLRYGKIMIMADQDEDGSHIKGLIINFIHYLWPNLLKNGFIVEFRTPLIKVSRGSTLLSFYSQQEFIEWKQSTENWQSWHMKYYKGLGTNTSMEAKEYFKAMDLHKIDYIHTGEEDDKNIDMTFGENTEQRKAWIIKYGGDQGDQVLKEFQNPLNEEGRRCVTYSDFINREMIQYSVMNIVRSIPSMVDGLKPSQRMVLYTCFEKKYSVNEMKVVQMAASVSNFTSYQHGEGSLMQTIVNLAQDFVGSNNINLLLPIGQFGTRLTGGKDAASARYIYTKLSPLAKLAFNPKDFPLLEHSSFDNQQTEPVCYYPILPMVLVNGASGIATGWNTKILNYNVRDIVINLLRMINGEKPTTMIPSYKGFKGEIEQITENKYKVYGCVEVLDDTRVLITELPVAVWTQSYRSDLEKMMKSNKILFYNEEHTDQTVKFEVVMDPEILRNKTDKDLLEYLKLVKVTWTNMVLLDERGVLKTYNNVSEIMEDFFKLRWKVYEKRKVYMEGLLEAEWSFFSNRVRFIRDKIDGKLTLENIKIGALKERLHELGYSKDPIQEWNNKNHRDKINVAKESIDEEVTEKVSQNGEFAYLLNMPLSILTLEHNKKLRRKLKVKENELVTLKGESVEDMWTVDLYEFLFILEQEESATKKDI